MSVARDLLAALPGVPLGADDPSVLERWTAGRTMNEMLVDTLCGLEGADMAEAATLIGSDEIRGVLACSSAHPCLAELAEWAEATPTVVLVASPAGPPPPAVLVYDKDPA